MRNTGGFFGNCWNWLWMHGHGLPPRFRDFLVFLSISYFSSTLLFEFANNILLWLYLTYHRVSFFKTLP
jgi:hypothetical protein